MYSGTTFNKFSGRVLGAHQKFDRVARRQLEKLIPENDVFPKVNSILSFEGKNGPDGVKRKSPAKDEPWHFFSPFDDEDSQILVTIQDHYNNLVRELKAANQERIAFEAAWLAHALVDGLTPAHHYPYEEKLIELRGGQDITTRTTFKQKLVMPGDNRRHQAKNNWKMWGPKGLLMSHIMFELGVAGIVKPLAFGESLPTEFQLQQVQEIGVAEWFKRTAREIAVLNMFERYQQKGWTPKLAHQVRHKLGPLIVQTITLAWYSALAEAKIIEGK